MKRTFLNALITLCITITSFNTMEAQTNTKQSLDPKQKSIITISAFTAIGNLSKLKIALNTGLDSGLTVNEIKDLLVQLYAYCGFPRSLNGVNTFMSVIEERKTQGITDNLGKEASPITTTANKYEVGKMNLQTLTGRVESGPKTGAAAFAPLIDTFLKEHLFADIFNRDVLDYSQRELTTIAALMSMPGVEPQLQAHIGMGLNVGLSESQIIELIALIETNIGEKEGNVGKETLKKFLALTQSTI